MKKTVAFLSKNKVNILLIYLFMQPFLDLITSLCLNVMHIHITIGMIVRFLFLGFLTLEFLFNKKSKTKKKKFYYLLITIIYFILFTSEILIVKGRNPLFYELSNMIRCFYFPISFILLVDYFETEKIEINLKTWNYLFMTYVILIFIPTITNTGFNGYTQGKVGNIGWFNSSNEISAILSLLLPLFVASLKFIKSKIIIVIEIMMTLYVIFNLGSKIVILTLGIIILYYAFLYLKKWIQNKEIKKLGLVATISIILLVISCILIPKTNFYKNIKIHLNFLEVDNITEVITNPKVFDHFIFSSRLTFLENTYTNYMDSSISEKLLGIGYIENYGTDEVSLKMIEMDPFDILFRQGILGFIIYFIPLSCALVELKDRSQKKKEPKNKSYMLSIIIGIILMCLSGHVLTSPAVSIYLSIILMLLLTVENITKNKRKRMK